MAKADPPMKEILLSTVSSCMPRFSTARRSPGPNTGTDDAPDGPIRITDHASEPSLRNRVGECAFGKRNVAMRRPSVLQAAVQARAEVVPTGLLSDLVTADAAPPSRTRRAPVQRSTS